ncbi:hypothetical protein COLO4_25460 [Corchorus olitorius]|uniref:Uncharacterized protein n=1 Tax=Corchorus olitorius TaxID=93759 RepID=A0A1R3I2K3_9ROSI|nr:hypothetical protein COLO4_25460 [Corchorus olitorius]
MAHAAIQAATEVQSSFIQVGANGIFLAEYGAFLP